MAKADYDYINRVREEIIAWEKEGPGFLSNVTDAILWLPSKMAEAMIPNGVQEAVAKAIEGCLNALMFSADYTFSDADVIKEVASHNAELNSLNRIANSNDLESMDLSANTFWNWNLGYAVAEGGVTGAGGLAGLAANIPALYAIVFRCIQQIALCYGFDTSNDEEKVYMLGILSVASSADVKSRQAAMVFMRQIQVDIMKKTWKKLAQEGGRGALITMIKQTAKTLGIQLTKRKALQLIPAIGALIGAGFDGAYLQDVARAAKNCYRKRRIENL